MMGLKKLLLKVSLKGGVRGVWFGLKSAVKLLLLKRKIKNIFKK